MGKVSLDLTGQWEFKQYPISARRMRDLDSADWMGACVPSSIFNSLIAADKIEQAEIDACPEKFSWVSETPWIYRKKFDASDELLSCENVELVFEGLDTVASIWLNEKLIAKTNNMFIPHQFDVKSHLKRENNFLLVKFEPAVAYAKKLMDRYTSFSEADFRNPYRTYIRKAQYQFGWDFCPSLPGCGIWRPVRLEGIKKARLDQVHIRTIDCNDKYADIRIAITLKAMKKESFLCKLTIDDGSEELEYSLHFAPGEKSHSMVIRIDDPALWWPAGLGQPSLYQLDVKLLNDGEIIDQKQEKFGIRTMRLNRSADGEREKFQFEVNGQSVFAKGANWVPASIFPGSIGCCDYDKLLGDAADANINMLRVWGGGYYESDEFYELCSRLGIMVWQDFMFACGYYPDRQWFLKEVKAEAAAVIKRLRNYPCMALWCGNNEIDWMHHNEKLGKSRKFHGKEIYHKVLPKIVAELDPDIDYIPTTPLAQKNDFKKGELLTNHQWGVWTDHQAVCQYFHSSQDVPGFVTEFGLQSMPGMEVVESFCRQEKPRIGSELVEKHNYQLDGNSRLYRYMGDLFGTVENVERFIYLSQITQARAVKGYVEYLRANNSKNAGVLFWQFNDCCPAISWSAIDSAKQPKALYYYAKRFFSKQLIAIIPESDSTRVNLPPILQSISVIVINDSKEPLTVKLNCRLIDLVGHQIDRVSVPVSISPFGNSARLKLPKAITYPDQPARSALHVTIDKEDEKITENLSFYQPDKYIDWPETQITKEFSRISEKCWAVKLKSNAIAKDVQIISSVPAKFSDNFIDLIPGGTFETKIEFCRQLDSLESIIRLRWVGMAI